MLQLALVVAATHCRANSGDNPTMSTNRDRAAAALFSGVKRGDVNVLDNAIRGHYIEALIWASLEKHNSFRATDSQWMNAGVGWGPWDLQRGRFDRGDRVRVQIKIKADVQLWKSQKDQPHKYTLGWNNKDAPKYFERDFEKAVFGTIEPPPSYRCDLFLLGWHGLGPQETTRRHFDQTVPDDYDFFIALVDELKEARTLRVADAFQRFGTTTGGGPWTFSDLPKALDAAADRFLKVRSTA